MRKILFLISLISLFSFNSSQIEKSIVGKWKGEDEKNKIGYIIFDSESYVTVETDGQTFGGKEFEMNGEKGSMSYSVNFEVEPIEIDLIMTKLATNEQRVMLLIAEFKGNDTMIVASDFNSVRPTEFSSENSITFHRIK
ncbi:hypothetical protein [Winogradskyella flava]|uniref:DUF4488 domain-containing protein n=1 Tax=Winogradskyella flava TaxID=1884876 RepID=A0A842IV53_9FLAO|nr:hypothetical protein [Winogradskyella flava]MBC2845804.1 hypothetical protein [Winogradskyella flava]